MAGDRRSAVFADRDGTLIKLVPYLHRPEDVEWIVGVPGAIRKLNEAGMPVIVVTNQAGVAHGYFSEDDIMRVHNHLQASLKKVGGRIDAFYHSPWHPTGSVEAYRAEHIDRKPRPGMFLRGIEEWSVEPARSFAVGDRNGDLNPARELGMTTVLVETGYGREERQQSHADHIAPDFTAAVDLILATG